MAMRTDTRLTDGLVDAMLEWIQTDLYAHRIDAAAGDLLVYEDEISEYVQSFYEGGVNTFVSDYGYRTYYP